MKFLQKFHTKKISKIYETIKCSNKKNYKYFDNNWGSNNPFETRKCNGNEIKGVDAIEVIFVLINGFSFNTVQRGLAVVVICKILSAATLNVVNENPNSVE